MSYFKDIQLGIRTTLKGLSLTFRHLRNATKRRTPEGIASANYFDLQNGLVTLQYPHEQLPIPDNGRYRLRNEIDDCIVCDKCAKVCPVDCITIDAIKATEEVGRASDGSPIRLYAGKFDIDMAKCCYCGLCTVVCPTECLTMDKKFDYSEFELGELTYHFSNLTPEQADEKRSLYEQFLQEKEAAKAAQLAAKAASGNQSTEPAAKPTASPARPIFKPTAKPVSKTPPAEPANSEGSSIEHPLTDATPEEMQQIAQCGLETKKHPVFKPTQKPATPPTDVPIEAKQDEQALPTEQPIASKPSAKPPGFRPSMKPAAGTSKPATSESDVNAAPETTVTPKPTAPSAKPTGFRPTMKPPVNETETPLTSEPPKAKPAFRPTMKPPVAKSEEPKSDTTETQEPSAPKPSGFRPTMKPAKPVETQPTQEPEAVKPEVTKPKPAGFRPTMKPAPTTPNIDESKAEPAIQAALEADEKDEAPRIDPPKSKPAFRPTMKPKAKPEDGQAE
ncbi:4Fe-4S dicluster domain-containing protein [Spirosoma validum]|uniref:4Fe-4S dicluster domain-containing protein n=1 Tax=Spirosoma validum TaxID=2771355 RepID=A0A927GBL7_9BACT|nr:4Fe-4S dicluster domain-containing protein [Spirosoma validum]MBD2751837.1 4Fe-4S dicluster domain-containing protein [Spirosoma validum]